MTVNQPEFECLLSIHDVMPETFWNVSMILDRYFEIPEFAPDLLIVPGCHWECKHIDQILKWAERGCNLVAHGWNHRIERYGGLFHRLHSVLISRQVAEHLQFKSHEIRSLMQDSFAWFSKTGLPEPVYYVPPAWALGSIRPEDLKTTPYSKVEVMRGFIDTQNAKLVPAPVLGYEADTAFRAWFLKIWNQQAINTANRHHQLLRVSIHPYDFEYLLKSDLEALLKHLRRKRS